MPRLLFALPLVAAALVSACRGDPVAARGRDLVGGWTGETRLYQGSYGGRVRTMTSVEHRTFGAGRFRSRTVLTDISTGDSFVSFASTGSYRATSPTGLRFTTDSTFSNDPEHPTQPRLVPFTDPGLGIARFSVDGALLTLDFACPLGVMCIVADIRRYFRDPL